MDNLRPARHLISVLFGVWLVLGNTNGTRAETEPAIVQDARALIAENGRAIVYFALPTYTYVSTGFNEYRRLSDGYELTFTFECKSMWRTNTMRLAFFFDQAGQFDWCKVVRHTSYWTPFTDAVGKKQLAKLRAFMADYPAVRDSRELMKVCENAGPKEMCQLYLKLEQAKRKATPATGAAGKERLETMFAQVFPVPARPADFVRTADQRRAVVVLHGLRPEFDRFLSTRAVLQDFQEPDSFLVKMLARDADVFAFAYGQNVPLEQIASAPELDKGLARLKEMGFAEIVLVGFSAGGLIAREYVEDHPHAGVTKVVQVCVAEWRGRLGQGRTADLSRTAGVHRISHDRGPAGMPTQSSGLADSGGCPIPLRRR